MNAVTNNTSRAPRLHEILAVEGTTESAYSQGMLQVNNHLKTKERQYSGQLRTLAIFNKNEENRLEMEAIEAKDRIDEPLNATIPATLNYMAVLIRDHFNVLYQKEATNQLAKADIVLANGEVLATDIPVTFLLGMESRLADFRSRIINEIPTLDPAHDWTLDSTKGPNVYRSPEQHSLKTSKEQTYHTKAQATQHHPAQVDTVTKDVNIGKYTAILFSGKISAVQKAELLRNVDAVLIAIKKARQRANSQEVVENKDVAGALMKAILGDFYNPATVLSPK